MSILRQLAELGKNLRDESLYRVIAHELPHGAVFVVDRHLRYVLADGSGLSMTGYVPEDFENKTVRETAPPAMADQYERDYRTVLAGGTFMREHEVRQRRYRSYGVPLRANTGAPELALVVSYDISDQMRRERQLGILSELGTVAQFADSCSTVVASVADLLGRYLDSACCFIADVDAGSSELVELTDLLQRHCLAGTFPLASIEDECLDALGSGRTITVPSSQSGIPRCAFLQKLGMQSFVLVPLVRDGALKGLFAVGSPFIHTWHDDDVALMSMVAERTWSAIECCRTLGVLKETDRHKNQILALLGHELRNPISALVAGVTLLKHSSSDGRTLDLAGLLERQVNQMQRIVDDLLGVSYVSFGKLALHVESIAFNALASTVTEMLLPTALRKHQQLSLTVPPSPLYLNGDRTKLTQVLTNLINNAIKYTPAEGRILIDVHEENDQIALRIEDNGIGMTPDVIAHLFELFVRGADRHATDTVQESGLGIGLWVVKQFVDAHHGHIAVTSPGPGLGSIFSVTLPKQA